MLDKLIPKILDAYKIPYSQIAPVQSGYRNKCYRVSTNDGQNINVIIYKNEPGIAKIISLANRASKHTAEHGMPVRFPVSSSILKMSSAKYARYAGVYNYLNGQTISWESYGRSHIKLVGWGLSNLHESLQSLDGSGFGDVTEQLSATADRMTSYFSDQNVIDALTRKLNLKINPLALEKVKEHLNLGSHLPDKQVLHMDFVRGNLLFSSSSSVNERFCINKTALSGIIDFEKVAFGPVVFDIARTLAFLLVDCAHYSEEKIRKYFLMSGYNKRGKNTFKLPQVTTKNGKYDLLDEYINFFLLHDYYKFLRHNPYEDLPANHHFIRTKEILLSRNMLEYI